MVVGLNEPETLRPGYFALIVSPKSDHAFARDHFEPSLPMRRPNVAAIDAHPDRTIGQGLSFPLLFRALEPIELALLTQLLLDAFCMLERRHPEHFARAESQLNVIQQTAVVNGSQRNVEVVRRPGIYWLEAPPIL